MSARARERPCCDNGHAYTPVNININPTTNGAECRACDRELRDFSYTQDADHPSTVKAKTIKCSLCQAKPGQWCVDLAGKPRLVGLVHYWRVACAHKDAFGDGSKGGNKWS